MKRNQGGFMVQQDNKPNLATTVDGQPILKKDVPADPTIEYPTNAVVRDDDPLLSSTERRDTREDDFQHSVKVKKDLGGSHPV
jgi:hypothetical protein